METATEDIPFGRGFYQLLEEILYLQAVITIIGNLITIDEKESGEACHCNCLYQLEYEITNLPVGEYSIRFIELCHEEGDAALEFTVNLEAEPTGEYCADRNHYPWNEN